MNAVTSGVPSVWAEFRTTGRLWTRDEIIARYQIGRSTFYTIPYFRATAIYVTPNTRRWADADVAAYEALNRGQAA